MANQGENFYPEQLRAIADICEALNALESQAKLYIENKVYVRDEHTRYGFLKDEIGGSWSFFPEIKDF